MDSLTQIVLGAAVGEIILGKKLGNKAQLLGAIAGTLPDMDVLYNVFVSDPVKQLAVHRGYSHSMFTHLVVSLPLAWISDKLDGKGVGLKTWYLFWFAGLFTHALLDCCTTYGTQFLLPFTNYQVAFNNISVIDPLYTIPFLILLAVCLFMKRTNPKRRKFLWASVMVSSCYLLFATVLKLNVHLKFKNSLQTANIQYDEINSTPSILNAILWNGVAYSEDTVWCTEYSYLKPEIPIRWVSYARNNELLKPYESETLNLLTWFSDGFYFAQQNSADTVAFYNVKWGRARYDTDKPEDTFVFYMHLYKKDGQVSFSQSERNFDVKEAFKNLTDRIGI